MLNEKLIEVLTSPPDGALTIVTEGPDGPHLANSWNSYVTVIDNRLIMPAGGFQKTGENLRLNPKVRLSVANREVQGLSYKGTGFIVEGTGAFLTEGPDFEAVKARFPWARAAFAVTVLATEQKL